MQEVITDKAQSAKGLLSQAIVSNGMVYTAGFVHLTPDGVLIDGSVADMTGQVLSNISEVLDAAGSSLSKVIKCTIYVTDMSYAVEFNEVYKSYFTSTPMPVREMVCVKELPLGAKIEMSIVAEA